MVVLQMINLTNIYNNSETTFVLSRQKLVENFAYVKSLLKYQAPSVIVLNLNLCHTSLKVIFSVILDQQVDYSTKTTETFLIDVCQSLVALGYNGKAGEEKIDYRLVAYILYLINATTTDVLASILEDLNSLFLGLDFGENIRNSINLKIRCRIDTSHIQYILTFRRTGDCGFELMFITSQYFNRSQKPDLFSKIKVIEVTTRAGDHAVGLFMEYNRQVLLEYSFTIQNIVVYNEYLIPNERPAINVGPNNLANEVYYFRANPKEFTSIGNVVLFTMDVHLFQ